MTLGQKISKLRKSRDLTQEDLAQKVGLHNRHISRLENDRMRPRAHTLARIAEVFEVSMDELVEPENGVAAISDPQLMRIFHQAEELDADDRSVVARIVQALLTKKRMEQAMKLSS